MMNILAAAASSSRNNDYINYNNNKIHAPLCPQNNLFVRVRGGNMDEILVDDNHNNNNSNNPKYVDNHDNNVTQEFSSLEEKVDDNDDDNGLLENDSNKKIVGDHPEMFEEENDNQNFGEKDDGTKESSLQSLSNLTSEGQDDGEDEGSAKLINNSDEENEEVDENDALEIASTLRQRGKELHDSGEFHLASKQFRRAAELLERYSGNDGNDDDEVAATCRLHEALCDLKQGGEKFSQRCVETCSVIIERQNMHSGAVRARAHLRRAKGRLALGDSEGALEDARAGAFLGDRSAVTLYGKLMRDISPDFDTQTSSFMNANDANPFLTSDWMAPSPFSSDSSKSMSSLVDLLSPKNGSSGLFPSSNGGDQQGMGTLAKSVLSSLLKKVDDEDTQQSICNFLNTACSNEDQIIQYASMAGIPLNEQHAAKIASISTNITPDGLRKCVSVSKKALKVIQILRKISKVIMRYRHFIVYYFLLAWIKSAILRPVNSPRIK